MTTTNRFYLGWQSRHIGTLECIDRKWVFDYEDGWLLPMTLAPNVRPRSIPQSVHSLMAEGFQLQAKIGNKEDALLQLLQRSERFLSNVVIVDDPAKIESHPIDRLEGRLRDFVDDSTFTGRIVGVPSMTPGFVQQMRDLVARRTMPIMSGYHAKIPMYLNTDGELAPADLKPFTHILKLPGVNGDLDFRRSLLEWVSLDIARAGGLNIAECSLVELSHGKVAMLSERFDICTDEDDMRIIFAEDFSAVMGKGLGSDAKYNSDTSLVATRLREVSTNFEKDSREFLRLVGANLLLENGDFHLKNLSVIKIASPTLDRFMTVRLSPAYDIMNTKALAPGAGPLQDDDDLESVVLAINGKEEDIQLRDLLALGKQMGIDPEEARAILADLAAGMVQRASDLYREPPQVVAKDETMLDTLRWVCKRAAKRVAALFPEIDCTIEQADEAVSLRRRANKP